MKGFSTPIYTPFTIANGPSTPNTHGSNDSSHYFAVNHQQGHPTSALNIQALELEKHLSGRFKLKPIDTIPNEILSLILQHGYFEFVDGVPNSAFRSLAATISRRFRDVTMHTPSLWGIVHLSPSNVSKEVQALPVYLERSKSHVLDIHLSTIWDEDLTEQVMNLLVPHSQRWRQLSIMTVNNHILPFLQNLPASFLQALTISHYSHQRRIALPPRVFDNDLPRLEYLCLRNVDIDGIEFSLRNIKTLEIRGHGVWPSFARLNEMLGGSNALHHLILHVKPAEVLQQVAVSETNGPTRLGQIILPKLAVFEVHTSEWLTEDLAEFVQLFVCPELQRFTMREGLTSPKDKPNTVMTYTALPTCSATQQNVESWEEETDTLGCRHILWVRLASVYHACRALSSSMAAAITTLELHRVYFPRLEQMKEMFETLKDLSTLLILDFLPNDCLSLIMDTDDLNDVDWEETRHSVAIPSLKALMLDFRPVAGGSVSTSYSWSRPEFTKEYTSDFVRLFSLPSLNSLVLKGAKLQQWQAVAEVFAHREAGYSESFSTITSLKIVDMMEPIPIPTDAIEQPHGYTDPVRAFPSLRSLSLKGINSNAFIKCLLHPTHNGGSPHSLGLPAWPNLHTLSISNDPNASKPLLHRVITAREEARRPLKRLVLDSHFARNAESWIWIKQSVDEVSLVDGVLGMQRDSGEEEVEVSGWR